MEEWSKDGGVLLMGYEMYRLLSMKKSFVMGKKRKSKKPIGPVIIDLDEEDRQQELMKGQRGFGFLTPDNGRKCCFLGKTGSPPVIPCDFSMPWLLCIPRY